MFDNNTSLIFILVIFSFCTPYFRKYNRKIYLRPKEFWDLVGSRERPVVLLATKGLAAMTHCYVFPHHGILFHTDLGQTESDRPSDVIIIKTSKDYKLV